MVEIQLTVVPKGRACPGCLNYFMDTMSDERGRLTVPEFAPRRRDRSKPIRFDQGGVTPPESTRDEGGRYFT